MTEIINRFKVFTPKERETIMEGLAKVAQDDNEPHWMFCLADDLYMEAQRGKPIDKKGDTE